MPNHVTNKLTIIGSQDKVKEVLEFIKIEEGNISGLGTIDFNKITPMPRWIYGFSDKVTGISFEDEKKYGEYNTSLGWARKNWGTKWNAYGQLDCKTKDNTIYFETAWNGVSELIQKLAWIFPKVEIEYSYCDEDFGYNLGKYRFKDTEILEKHLPIGGSKEAFELGLEIMQCDPEEKYIKYNPNIDNYEYTED